MAFNNKMKIPKSHYKLTYFNVTGLAEGIRLILTWAGQEFEDNRIARADWPNLKDAQPFQQMPVFEVDGKVLVQSVAICRFLGKRFGLWTNDPIKEAQLEAVVDHLRDVTSKNMVAQKYKTPENEKAAADTMKLVFTKLNEACEEGYFYNFKPTWVDLYFAGLAETYNTHMPGIFQPYPNLERLHNSIMENEKIKQYALNRPFPESFSN